MDPFERGRQGKLLTDAEGGGRSRVMWPQGSMASDAVYPLLHELNPQPSGDVVYPLLHELNPQPSGDVVYPLLHELNPQPSSDAVYPLLYELNPQPSSGVVYPQILNSSMQQPLFADMMAQPESVVIPYEWLASENRFIPAHKRHAHSGGASCGQSCCARLPALYERPAMVTEGATFDPRQEEKHVFPLSTMEVLYRKQMNTRSFLGNLFMEYSILEDSYLEEIRESKGNIPGFEDNKMRPSFRGQRDYMKEMTEYLNKNPQVKNSIAWFSHNNKNGIANWSFDSSLWIPYEQWPDLLKLILGGIYADFASGQYTTERYLALFPESIPEQLGGYDYNTMTGLYLTQVAYSVWIEIEEMFPWRLHEHSLEGIRWLLHGYFFVMPASSFDKVEHYVCGHLGVVQTDKGFRQRGYVLQTGPANPMVLSQYLLQQGVVERTPEWMKQDASNMLLGAKKKLMEQAQRQAISKLSRWFQNKVNHSGLEHTITYYFSRDTAISFNLSVDYFLGKPLSYARVERLKELYKKAYDDTSLPVNQVFNKQGVFMCGSQPISFSKHCSYKGCHSASGAMHWLFRSLNIPSLSITTVMHYEPTRPDPLATFDHGAIKICLLAFDKSQEKLYLPHLDYLYAMEWFLDPNMDLINFYMNEDSYERWFGYRENYNPWLKTQVELWEDLITNYYNQTATAIIEYWSLTNAATLGRYMDKIIREKMIPLSQLQRLLEVPNMTYDGIYRKYVGYRIQNPEEDFKKLTGARRRLYHRVESLMQKGWNFITYKDYIKSWHASLNK